MPNIFFKNLPCNSCISTHEWQNWLILLYFGENDANACEAQEGKCVCSIYSHLSCAVVAHSVPNALQQASSVPGANTVHATALKLGIIRGDH